MVHEQGHIVSFFSGVAKIEGLPHVFLHEVLLDEKENAVAIVIGFNEHHVEALFFDDRFDAANSVMRSGKLFSLSLSDACVGRVLNGLGMPRDGLQDIAGNTIAVFAGAPSIIDREPVSVPLSTGIKMIDSILPLGRGQRELIIGDRKLGKSTLAIDTVLHQKHATPSVYCVYVVCGQKEEQLQELATLFEHRGAMLYSVIVAATAGDSFAAQYLAPFVGCAIGEYFRNQGKDALVVYDDLSKHARTYRSISLLLERAPGREAYPGDIFSLHATLLERAAQLAKKNGGGSLTALPIIETQEDDITSFIPTNIISITDGQIYLNRGLFQKGFIPAVDIGLSVSRVGSQAQQKALSAVVGGMRLAIAQYKELRKLSQLETNVSTKAEQEIKRGALLLAALKQDKHTGVSWVVQVILFCAITRGYFDDLEEEKWTDMVRVFPEMIPIRYADMVAEITRNGLTEKAIAMIRYSADDFIHEFFPTW
ncbi:MAG: F0F1 ATP synthase subunit alpha [Patescibacteria group bacterium]|nr:F0F1 ATP synthase subunit alpha [Patescibacteria group bacterium]